MKSSINKAFRRALSQLPRNVQTQAKKAYRLWKTDPYHNSLQFKRVNPEPPIYSVRISLNYRALGLLESDHHIYWFWIGTHAEYDNFLRRL
jgi:hypothetical protein